MEIRWLGWAGVEIEHDGERVVVDPLDDPAAVFAALGERTRRGHARAGGRASRGAGALAGLVTHLHRDHADAAALTAALVPGAPVYEPAGYGGDGLEQLAVAQADHELDRGEPEPQPDRAVEQRPGRSLHPHRASRPSTAPATRRSHG